MLRFGAPGLPGSVEAVWQAVTDPEEMRTWFPTRIEIDEWAVGATLTHHFDEHDIDALPGTVLEWDPPRRLSSPRGPDTISFGLTEASDGGTTFVLTEELSANHAAAQRRRMGRLPRPAPARRREESSKKRLDRYVASFEPVLGHQDGPPEGVQDPDA